MKHLMRSSSADPGAASVLVAEVTMKDHEEDCIWVRTEAWLVTDAGGRVKVQTRKICRSGVFLEGSWPGLHQSVEVVFPDPSARDGGRRILGYVTRSGSDGIWVRFTRELRSSAEMLMRSGLPRMSPKSRLAAPPVSANC
jgi:hypothetical protein